MTYKIAISVKPHLTLTDILVHPKDKIEAEDKMGVVTCKNCDQLYIRETGKELSVGTKECKSEVPNASQA